MCGYLYRYIFPNVKHNLTLAEDLTNGSLEKVFKKLTTCRVFEFDPESSELTHLAAPSETEPEIS